MSAPSMEGELKIMIKDTDKKKEAMTRIEMRISKEDKAIIEQKACPRAVWKRSTPRTR